MVQRLLMIMPIFYNGGYLYTKPFVAAIATKIFSISSLRPLVLIAHVFLNCSDLKAAGLFVMLITRDGFESDCPERKS